jgi:trans-2,3-dihydro-3-hydroxyanthranilate isomerase
VRGCEKLLGAVALFEYLDFAAQNNRQANVSLPGFVNDVTALHERLLSQGPKQRQLMIVELWERDAFGIAVELFVSLLVSHLETLRATQHNPNLRRERRRTFLSREALWSAAVLRRFSEFLLRLRKQKTITLSCANSITGKLLFVLHVLRHTLEGFLMPGRAYEFVQVDVFTQTPLAGNPLAIFTDGRGLNDAEMQALAREMNLSETTFILPRDPATEAREGKKVRIFTVEQELPFAGHPTLGTALHLYASEFASSLQKSEQVTLDLKAGKIPVRFTPDSENAGNRVDGQVFGEMRQRDPEFGTPLSRDEVARVIGIAGDEIPSEWPIQPVSTGLTFTIVPFRNRQTLSDLKFTYAQASEFLKNTGADFFYFLCPERREAGLEARARMFFYGGEDPATGSAAGCAASWMVQHGVARTDEQVVIHQGNECRRPSEMHVRATWEGERVTNVRVGGYAVETLRGTVVL